MYKSILQLLTRDGEDQRKKKKKNKILKTSQKQKPYLNIHIREKRMDSNNVISIIRPEEIAYSESSDVEMSDEDGLKNQSVVTPGELVTDDPVWMKGHGTYFLNDQTYSCVAGNISRVNRLLSVIPLRGRYLPETGDHVVGRITEVGAKRWKVDIGAKQDATLMLGSVNLPGGVLRRKSESDELQMRAFLKEGDLLNAEVQSIYSNGSAALHTRSLNYGKLRNGMFLRVPANLIVKSKNHSFDLPGNVSVILGVNGYVWLSKTSNTRSRIINDRNLNKVQASVGSERTYQPGNASVSITRLEEESSWDIYSDRNDPDISSSLRLNISRYYNILKALSFCELGITEQRIIMGYEASLAYSNVGNLIDKESMEGIGNEIINQEKLRGKI